MWHFEEDVTPSEAVEFANEGGLEAIRHFTDNSLNSKEVILALCDAGFSTEAILCASPQLMADFNVVSELVEYASGYGLKQIYDKTTQDIRNQLGPALKFPNVPSVEEQTQRTHDLFEELNSVIPTNSPKLKI